MDSCRNWNTSSVFIHKYITNYSSQYLSSCRICCYSLLISNVIINGIHKFYLNYILIYFNPKHDWEIHGRGGTSFQPVIDHYNEKKGAYTALVYLTDGEAYSPDDCPKNTLWVHSSVSEINDELPGQKIKLN